MKYGFNTDNKEGSGQTLVVGINEGWEMTGVVFNGETDYPNIEFTFKAPTGGDLKHKEFSVNEDSEWAEQSMERMNSRVVHILRRFMPKEKAVIPAVESFEAYAKAIVKLVAGATYKGVKLRAKTSYNKKGFVSFPMFPDFLENMNDVKAEDSKLRLTAYDNLEKPNSQKMEKKSEGQVPAGVSAGTTTAPTDDLSF